MSRVAAIVVVALTACGSPSLEPGFEDALTVTSGCSDIVLYAHNDEDTVGVFAIFSPILEELGPASQEEVFVFDLADPVGVTVLVETGEHITHLTCNDAIEFEPTTDQTWLPTGGTATLTVRTNATIDDAPRADLTLTDMVLESGDATVHVPSVVWTDIAIGWLPG